MKKYVAVLAAALIAPALAAAGAAPAVAQTAPREPVAKPVPGDAVTVVKAQFAKKSGVRLSETLRMTFNKQTLLDVRRTGLLRFGPSGVTSFDVTTTATDRTEDEKKTETTRVIAAGKYGYSQGVETADLPEGKKWVRFTDYATPPSSLSVDILNPKVLKAVLASTKDKVKGEKIDGTRTTVYRGTIDLKTLAKADKRNQSLVLLLGEITNAKDKLSWKLWLGEDNLPRRFTSSYVLLADKNGDATITSDTGFTAWGTKAEVKAPPAAEVIDRKNLPSEAQEEAEENFLIPFGDPYKNLKLTRG